MRPFFIHFTCQMMEQCFVAQVKGSLVDAIVAVVAVRSLPRAIVSMRAKIMKLRDIEVARACGCRS